MASQNIPVSNITTITWEQSDASDLGYETLKPAVEIGSVWYVNSNSFSTAYCASIADAQLQTFTSSSGTWQTLDFSSSGYLLRSGVNVALPSGTLAGLGFLGSITTDSMRINTVTVNTTPEPSTLAMVLAGGVTLAMWGWRRRTR